MAQHLAKIFGTEEDKVNCPFYLKMGACRHGDRCSRIHNRPVLSQTILLQNMVGDAPPSAGDLPLSAGQPPLTRVCPSPLAVPAAAAAVRPGRPAHPARRGRAAGPL